MLKPISSTNWDYAKAAHLLNRAGFGGRPAEIQKLADLGLDGAVSALLDFEKIPDPTPAPDWAKPDAEQMKKIQEVNRSGTPADKKQLQQELQQTHHGIARLVVAAHGFRPAAIAGENGAVLARPFCDEL